jgi:hypothetical protein
MPLAASGRADAASVQGLSEGGTVSHNRSGPAKPTVPAHCRAGELRPAEMDEEIERIVAEAARGDGFL